MARLSSYYTLCPLIDQQNLLGVENDSDPGCAIVTLGKNIVIRYKLQDTKQVSSWSTKDRLTTQVIYDDTSNKYAAVFNGKNIRTWQEDETNLDNVKKFKFPSPIHAILSFKGISPILVMQNGATVSLEWAIENRKTWSNPGILKPNETISSCQLVCVKNEIYMCALTKLENVYNFVVVPLNGENYTGEADKVVRIDMKRPSEKLIGHVVMQDNKNAYLLTLWSHGRLYMYPLITPTTESIPGTLISVITAVNTKHPVVMVALNETTIAAYGADAHEEGAVLLIYNVQFKLVQAIQKLKLYTNDAKLWKIEDKLLLAANRHLAIAPYSLAVQRIEAMLGSTLHCNNEDSTEDNDIEIIQESTIADWNLAASLDKINDGLPLHELDSRIATQVSTFKREGLSDAAIQRNLIPQLIESKDISSILWCLDHLKELPEELLIQLLGFCLRTYNNVTSLPQNGHTGSPSTHNESLFDTFLTKILSICYTDVSIISYLRAGLNFDQILELLNYMITKLGDDENHTYSSETSESEHNFNKQLYEWTKLLLDSHYQHYVLSQDTQVLPLLNKLDEALESHADLIKDLQSLRPMIHRLMRGKILKAIPNDVNRFYSIEEVKLY
ncbi:hypothetical protein TSAR_010235 [Trichomalopsis sarcophagae]|uniref:Nucleolar protein 11 n=1 Tax=Trichomalopsis sarcophagae TaxID=543379 RepID=A0A232FJC8_9HYME|nr:hypothetical protein TSAR_010235 [Trichomalopsis sarcophagae]